jgi:asparagine synthase (glutamine-hydrolysing)
MEMIQLFHNKGFSWYTESEISVKGYLFDNLNNFIYGEQLINYFSGISSFPDFEERVSFANGVFSVIIRKEKEFFVAADTIRSFPLFYARFQGKWIISDDIYKLSELTQIHEINTMAKNEFLATGYVIGDETLLNGVRQVQAGEIIHFKEDDLKAKFYFSYRTHQAREEEYQILKNEGEEVFEESFGRFVSSLQGRTVVVPLSGGYDSRLIVSMLKHFQYDNVMCFTYGRKDNPEIELSRKVAEKLNYKWLYIEYTEDLIHDYISKPDFLAYFPYASQMVSMFYMQEYFAVKYMKDNKIIPYDAIFAPGHSGDFLAGSMLNKHGNLSIDESMSELADRIYFIKYCYKQPNASIQIRILDRIEKNIQEKYMKDSDMAYSIHEDWDFKEKFAKFIVNANTTYTYFGYEFRSPFWDRKLVDFFKFLPLSAKINKYLYDDLLSNKYFAEQDINFENEFRILESDIRNYKIKSQIKQYLPENVNRLFVNKKDGLFYREITRIMKDDLLNKNIKIKIHGNSYNSLIIQWYLYQLDSFLKNFDKEEKNRQEC